MKRIAWMMIFLFCAAALLLMATPVAYAVPGASGDVLNLASTAYDWETVEYSMPEVEQQVIGLTYVNNNGTLNTVLVFECFEYGCTFAAMG